MKTNRDILFKVGLGLQLVLIPIAFLWRFGPEANYYNWVLAGCLVTIVALCFWPQAVVLRLKRLKAIKVQFVLVLALLGLSWAAYGYFYHYTRSNCYPATPINGQSEVVMSYGPEDRGKNCNFDESRYDLASPMIIYDIGVGPLRYVFVLGPGISIPSALALTAVFITLPAANLYRYKLDKKRVHGLKKEDLFA